MSRQRSILAVVLAILASCMLAAPAGAQISASPISDVQAGSEASDPNNFIRVNGEVFFTADDGPHGIELWKTDGGSDGTTLVKDINPGGGDSFPSELTRVNNTLFFSATDGEGGSELWKSDGTAAGTVMVKDLMPGADSSDPDELTDVAGTLFFSANGQGSSGGALGTELWRSDGSTAGTTLVKDINPTPEEGSFPHELLALGTTVYFAADDGSKGIELWSSDGTGAGTTIEGNINAGVGSSDPEYLTPLNGKLFFAASTESTGRELWARDLNANTSTLVKDIAPGTLGFPGCELLPSGCPPASGFPAGLKVFNDKLLFKADNALVGGQGLWSSDGSTAGTTLIQSLDSMSQALVKVSSGVFFLGSDGLHGIELWKTDGTVGGTQVLDVSPGSSDTGVSVNAGFAAVNNRLFFAAGSDNELWTSDGTVAGTGEVMDINPDGPSSPTGLANAGGTLYFAAEDGARGKEPWRATPGLEPTINSGPSGATTQRRPTFTFASGDELATYFCSLDQGAPSFVPCSGNGSHQPASDLADGGWVFRVRAIDPFSNSATVTRSFVVDTLVPSLSVIGGPTGATNDQRPSFQFEAEPGTTVRCSIDQGTPDFGACSAAASHQPAAPLADGAHTFRVRATDEAGNVATATRSFTVLDITPPTLSVTGGPNDLTSDVRPTFSFLAEQGSIVQCSVDQGVPAFGPCSGASSHQPAAELADGAYTFRVKAADLVGNIATRTHSFIVDSGPPSLSITGGPNGPTADPRPNFSFLAEADAAVQCSIDEGTPNFGSCSGASAHQPASALADGPHTFRVKATDLAGNLVVQTRDFVVDTAPPGLSITGGPEGGTTDRRPAFTWSADPGATVACSVDQGTPEFAPCSGTGIHQPGTDLVDGAYTFRVRASDVLGNLVTLTRAFNVVTTPDPPPPPPPPPEPGAPTVTITGGPSGPTKDSTPTFKFVSSDPTASFLCAIDGGAPATCTSPRTLKKLRPGRHRFSVIAVSAAGKQSVAASRSFKVKRKKPRR